MLDFYPSLTNKELTEQIVLEICLHITHRGKNFENQIDLS